MKKLLLLLAVFLMVSTVTIGQTCIMVENDTVAFNTKNFTTIFTDDSRDVVRYDFGYLNYDCSWDTMFTYYFLENGLDSLEVNDSLAYLTTITGTTLYDSIIRKTWKKHEGEWHHTFTDANGYSIEPMWAKNDTMHSIIFYDENGEMLEFWRKLPENAPILNDYVFNSNGDIIEENVHQDETTLNLFKYEKNGSVSIKLDHYPSMDTERWVIDENESSILIQFQVWDDFWYRWDVITEKEYPTCWFYVGVEDIPTDDATVTDVRYFNIVGQTIEKPSKGFYIEQRITSNGSTTKKYYVQ